MHMSMQEILRLILVKKCTKYLKSLVWQIHPVIQLISRGMCHQDIKSPVPEQLKPQLPDTVLHLPFRILEFPGAITHRTAKPQDPYTLVYIDLIVNAS